MPEPYAISAEAQDDLDGIALYGTESYSVERILDYDAELHRAFERLALFPDSGRTVPGLRDGVKALVVLQHIVFYRPRPRPVSIVRVMHQRADWIAALTSQPQN